MDNIQNPQPNTKVNGQTQKIKVETIFVGKPKKIIKKPKTKNQKLK